MIRVRRMTKATVNTRKMVHASCATVMNTVFTVVINTCPSAPKSIGIKSWSWNCAWTVFSQSILQATVNRTTVVANAHVDIIALYMMNMHVLLTTHVVTVFNNMPGKAPETTRSLEVATRQLPLEGLWHWKIIWATHSITVLHLLWMSIAPSTNLNTTHLQKYVWESLQLSQRTPAMGNAHKICNTHDNM